jgi:hypothetical protein
MKKIILLSFALTFFSCGNNKKKEAVILNEKVDINPVKIDSNLRKKDVELV